MGVGGLPCPAVRKPEEPSQPYRTFPPTPQPPQSPTLQGRGLSDSLRNHPPRLPERGCTWQCLGAWEEGRSPRGRGCASKGLEGAIGMEDGGNCGWGRGAAAPPPRQLL